MVLYIKRVRVWGVAIAPIVLGIPKKSHITVSSLQKRSDNLKSPPPTLLKPSDVHVYSVVHAIVYRNTIVYRNV